MKFEDRRGSSSRRGYGYKWQQASKGYLRKHPYCAEHERRGIVESAMVVDHITPHKGDMVSFWDKDNWQGLCKHCHDSYKKRLENSGVEIGCDTSGIPTFPQHHWNLASRGGSCE